MAKTLQPTGSAVTRQRRAPTVKVTLQAPTLAEGLLVNPDMYGLPAHVLRTLASDTLVHHVLLFLPDLPDCPVSN